MLQYTPVEQSKKMFTLPIFLSVTLHNYIHCYITVKHTSIGDIKGQKFDISGDWVDNLKSIVTQSHISGSI